MRIKILKRFAYLHSLKSMSDSLMCINDIYFRSSWYFRLVYFDSLEVQTAKLFINCFELNIIWYDIQKNLLSVVYSYLLRHLFDESKKPSLWQKLEAHAGVWPVGQFSGRDDLRQDAVMQQVFSLMNAMLRNDPDTRKRRLQIRQYRVRLELFCFSLATSFRDLIA